MFDTEAVVVEADGKVTKMASAEVAQDSAQSHAPSTPPLSDALGAFTNPNEAPVEEQAPAEDGLDLSMMKKKKKKSKKTEDADGEAAADEGGLDLTVRALRIPCPWSGAAMLTNRADEEEEEEVQED